MHDAHFRYSSFTMLNPYLMLALKMPVAYIVNQRNRPSEGNRAMFYNTPLNIILTIIAAAAIGMLLVTYFHTL